MSGDVLNSIFSNIDSIIRCNQAFLDGLNQVRALLHTLTLALATHRTSKAANISLAASFYTNRSFLSVRSRSMPMPPSASSSLAWPSTLRCTRSTAPTNRPRSRPSMSRVERALAFVNAFKYVASIARWMIVSELGSERATDTHRHMRRRCHGIELPFGHSVQGSVPAELLDQTHPACVQVSIATEGSWQIAHTSTLLIDCLIHRDSHTLSLSLCLYLAISLGVAAIHPREPFRLSAAARSHGQDYGIAAPKLLHSLYN